MATKTIVLTLEVADGPYDVDDTVAELGAALPAVIDDAWSEPDDRLKTNRLRVAAVLDVDRGIAL